MPPTMIGIETICISSVLFDGIKYVLVLVALSKSSDTMCRGAAFFTTV